MLANLRDPFSFKMGPFDGVKEKKCFIINLQNNVDVAKIQNDFEKHFTHFKIANVENNDKIDIANFITTGICLLFNIDFILNILNKLKHNLQKSVKQQMTLYLHFCFTQNVENLKVIKKCN